MRNERERLSSSDEVDLIELVQGAWRQKIWIVAVALPVLLIGIAFAQLSSPIYEAKLFVQSPTQTDIAQLNYGRGGDTGLSVISAKDVYDVYLRNLQSEALRNRFFRTIYLPTLSEEERNGSRDALYNQFNTMLKVGVASKDMPSRYAITANVEDPRQAAQWVSAYAGMAADAAKREILKGSKSEVMVKADNLEQQIMSAQATARKQREDQIAQLKEALKVARSIGLEKPPIIARDLTSEVTAGMDGSLSYMRGTKALEAEIANLEARPSDDPFIKGLRAKQARLNFYRDLRIEPSLIAVYQQDGGVEQPDKPIKPRKAIIVLISLIVGLGLGLAVALVRDFLIRRDLQTR